ncbi:hypothetical protein [Ponticaulis sp.]|uniref:hypothetical protein n=1 Tax=Ponticaulis sp. TaxID=2020902 RepID=UPI00262A7E15|nr:hypothetical protein [Ponticaulis sp.]MDF1680996.1 hypothetical protein [Ponticaulis sp.]
MRLLVSSALAGSALLLSACSTFENLDTRPNQGPCPAAGSVYEAQRIVEFTEGGDQYNNIEFTGEINGVRLFCRYLEDDPIEAQIEIDFAFGRGDAATTNQHTFNYFVAVTRTNRAVIEKQVFPVNVEFRNGRQIVTMEETVGRIVIPRADSSISGANFEILVGFELTDEQRTFNETGRRFLLQTQ